MEGDSLRLRVHHVLRDLSAAHNSSGRIENQTIVSGRWASATAVHVMGVPHGRCRSRRTRPRARGRNGRKDGDGDGNVANLQEHGKGLARGQVELEAPDLQGQGAGGATRMLVLISLS